MTRITRSYTELSRLHTFEDRFDYLRLNGVVAHETFGHDRYLNQRFYTSREWRQIRQHVIARDNACDLGVEGFEIHRGLYIHHLNPMVANDLIAEDETILDPEFLITTSHRTQRNSLW